MNFFYLYSKLECVIERKKIPERVNKYFINIFIQSHLQSHLIAM